MPGYGLRFLVNRSGGRYLERKGGSRIDNLSTLFECQHHQGLYDVAMSRSDVSSGLLQRRGSARLSRWSAKGGFLCAAKGSCLRIRTRRSE